MVPPKALKSTGETFYKGRKEPVFSSRFFHDAAEVETCSPTVTLRGVRQSCPPAEVAAPPPSLFWTVN